MRLVIKFTITDNFTYWFVHSEPIVYDSPEQFIVDFELAINEARKNRTSDFVVAGTKFDVGDFFHWPEHDGDPIYEGPQILTLDEWYKGKQ